MAKKFRTYSEIVQAMFTFSPKNRKISGNRRECLSKNPDYQIMYIYSVTVYIITCVHIHGLL